MEMEQVLGFISNNGFAIVVAMYSLTRLENTIKENTKVIQHLASRMVGGNSNE